MSTGEKKPTPLTTPPTTTPPATPAQQQSKLAQPVKNPLISRRVFLKAAVGASTVLAAASMATSGQILAPRKPKAKDPEIIANAQDLENDYYASTAGSTAITNRIFFWPYDASESVYYKNILARLPDELLPVADRGSTPSMTHYVAWNTTCVHLRCLVNPGIADGEYRLLCPCHGSQYRLADAVPVKGPAYLLGLNPLPRIRLRLDSNNNIIAEEFVGEPGIGRTQV